MKLDYRWKDSLQRDCVEIQRWHDDWNRRERCKVGAQFAAFGGGVVLLMEVLVETVLSAFQLGFVAGLACVGAWHLYEGAQAWKRQYKRTMPIEKRWRDVDVSIFHDTTEIDGYRNDPSKILPYVYFEKEKFDPFCEDSYGELDSE